MRTDLSTGVTAAEGRHAGVQCSTTPEAGEGVTTGASHLMLLPLYLFFITMAIFLNICCFSDRVIHTS